MEKVSDRAGVIEERLLERNRIFEAFFARESHRLALACREMSERFLSGGRILAFGKGPYATDAQHVSVEFVHPIIVGKRALPALDLSLLFHPWLDAIVGPEDMVMGFGPPEGDPEIDGALRSAEARGAMTFAFSGEQGSYIMDPPSSDPFIHQELVEILYHTLWETVHVFFEHRELGQDAGESAFLYPFLSGVKQETGGIVAMVAESIEVKAREDAMLRERAAREESEKIADAARAIHERVQNGGKLILFGNGGSATDANDFAMDCVMPPHAWRPVPAISLSIEPASLTAIANDVGIELIFLRQMIAHARPEDVAVAFSTSGGSRNIILALDEAKKRGLLTVALLGYDGGEILRGGHADYPLVVRSDYIPRIQEVQASIYHVLRGELESLNHA
ncbi:MAG: SIS domain-containing protein [Bryobacteraceae bacterium]